MTIKSFLPNCLSHNPNWVYFYEVCDYLWREEVLNNIPQLATQDTVGDIDTATREDILLRASRIGWTFADNFSANWEDDERAERFLKRFIESWIPYCRDSDGTVSLQDYMGYLLGMEIRIVQLWSNAKSEWDSKPLAKVFNQGTTQLPENFMIKSVSEDPFATGAESQELKSIASLDNTMPGWKNVVDDPENGWYPTSHFDVYVDLYQVPKSDLQEKSAEEIIAGLFYELADLDMVLHAIVYSYSFNQVVKVASGMSIVDRLQAIDYGAPLVPEWGLWSINPIVTVNQRDATYTGTKTNGITTLEGTATLNVNSPMVDALSVDYYRTMGVIATTTNAIAQGKPVTWDVPNKKIIYESSDPFIETISMSFENGEARDLVSNQVWGSFGNSVEVVPSSPLLTGGALHAWNWDSAITSPLYEVADSFRITYDFYYSDFSAGGYGQPQLAILDPGGQRAFIIQLFNNAISLRAYNVDLSSDWYSPIHVEKNTKYSLDFQVIDGVPTLHINGVNIPVSGTWAARSVHFQLGAPAAQDWNNIRDSYFDNFKVYGVSDGVVQKSTTFQEIVDVIVQDSITETASMNWIKAVAGSHSDEMQEKRMLSSTEVRAALEASIT